MLVDTASWPLWGLIAVFLVAAATIGYFGSRLAEAADRIADATGFGEALVGAVLLGGATSLPGIVTSAWTAWQGYAELAVSNAVGGIAVQTAFLAVADICYRKANLEHAAASVENLVQGALLTALLAIPIMSMSGPEVAVFAVHPGTIFIICGYFFGLRIVSATRDAPPWTPRATRETKVDEADPEAERGAGPKLFFTFAVCAVIVAVAGFVVAQTGIQISERTGLSQGVVGMLLTAVATSLPELVTSIAAVRRGALTLAVGGIIGGNSFDTLFLAFADVAYRDGSIYHAMKGEQVFTIGLSILLTGILLLGLLRREKSGMANIGFESALVLAIYLGSVAVMVV